LLSKNLAGYMYLKIILLNHQNNDVERLNISDNAKCFNISSISLFRLFYIIIAMVQTKLFSGLYLAKFLDTSNPFFPFKNSFFLCVNA